MATRPAKPRPAQAQSQSAQAGQSARTAARSVQAAKSAHARKARAQSAEGQPAKPQPARSGAAQAKPGPSAGAGQPVPSASPPRELRLAAALQALEAAGMLVAAGLAAVATAEGHSYERSSGIALTLISVATAGLFAAFAAGLAKARPWTRTPVVMFQLAIGVWGVFLLTGRDYAWAIPMLLLPAAILACVFTPRALRALNRPPRTPD